MSDDRSEFPHDSPITVAPEEGDPLLTTPEDVASAGRSCMAIVIMGAIIVALIVIWVVYRALESG